MPKAFAAQHQSEDGGGNDAFESVFRWPNGSRHELAARKSRTTSLDALGGEDGRSCCRLEMNGAATLRPHDGELALMIHNMRICEEHRRR